MAFSTLRPAKRARTASQGSNPMMNMMSQMGMNPMMMGMNPMMMNPMMAMMNGMSAEDDQDDQESVAPEPGQDGSASASASAAPPAAAPAAAGGYGIFELDSDDVNNYGHLSPDQPISRSYTFIKQIAFNRLSECLEVASGGSVQATMTAGLSKPALLALFWIYTRQRPTIKISDLRGSVFNETTVLCQ